MKACDDWRVKYMGLKESSNGDIATIIWRKKEAKNNEKPCETNDRMTKDLEKEFPNVKILLIPREDNIVEIQLHTQNPSKSKDFFILKQKTAQQITTYPDPAFHRS